ncbi:DNA replication/repair protein RecF [Streptococcus caprae]|uniref:DNA replication and repair protein RecF n=1 Tax=Streptococcus caprae TaxID=1640501 RepID=A0ABV8CWD5_9STRE
MWLERLSLHHYRNYKNLDIEFAPGINVFVGQNAQGKTNLLESIYFLSLTRSHRTRSDKDLINFTEKDVSLSGLLHKSNSKVPLDIILTDKGRVTKVNHLKQAKLSDYIGTMTVVLFAPEDLQLIKGSPSLRRKFIDIDLGQIKTLYLSDLSSYNHVLKQRNSYLKSTDKVDTIFLSVLDEQLADFGSRVMEHRLQFIKDLQIEADKHHHNISNKLEHIRIEYLSSVKLTEGVNLRQAFVNQLEKSRQRDIFKKNTGVGPHRDDLAFFINDMDANFASQGQHRSLILSLKMAEIELIKQTTGDYPILLLDDVMSELDNHRQTKLLESITDKVQTFITTTSLDHLSKLPNEIKHFSIEAGVVIEN